MTSKTFKAVIAAAVLMAAPIGAWAQGPRRNSAEIAAGGGYAYLNTGDAYSSGPKNHGTYGASFSYNPVALLSIGFDYTGTPLDSETYEGVKFTERLYNYGAIVREGLMSNRTYVPYILFTAGAVRLVEKASDGNETASFTQGGEYYGLGGGGNIYVGHGFGIRPEFRYEHQHFSVTNYEGEIIPADGRNEMFLTGSLFYQFGGRHR